MPAITWTKPSASTPFLNLTHPERFGEEPNSTGYQDGDTWYRDMRMPGFERQVAPSDSDSVQWLATQIVQDPRFAAATVKFWWPAIYGAEMLIAPEDPGGPNYAQRLRAYNAQESLVTQLAEKFVAAEFRLKLLLAEMLTSLWYRADGLHDQEAAEHRSLGAGKYRKREIVNEELARKNLAVFGRIWGQAGDERTDPQYYGDTSKLEDDRDDTLKIFYGGTDSAGLITRNRGRRPH